MAKVFGLIRRAKELYSWYSFAIGIGALFLTGFGIATGGAVWLIRSGIPIPLAIMAGYCTLVGAVYLAMAPLAYRALAPRQKHQAAPSKDMGRRPNYEAWKHVDVLSLDVVSHLWADVDPNASDTYDTAAWLHALESAVKKGELELVPQTFGRHAAEEERMKPDGDTVVTRDALKRFAKKYNYDPLFLRDT